MTQIKEDHSVQSKSELLEACYRVLLGREPDNLAKSHWISGQEEFINLHQLLTSISGSSEFSEKWKETLFQPTNIGTFGFFNEQSQYGEIGRLILHLVNTTASHRIVVDVGANGRERSNSYDLLRFFGWHGLLIEANINRVKIIEEDFKGLDYHLINCAISDYTGTATFHLGVNDDVSSLQIEAAEGWGPVQGEVTVTVRPLHNILDEHNIPHDFDLLSIDAEGEDIRILNDTISRGYRPRWIIIEAIHDQVAPSLEPLGLTDLVRSCYHIVDSTVSNLILNHKPLDT